ncbi:hypothetical protein SAMN06295888_11072 [Desulfonatronum zhilinae]|nr:hypothetical protein SAMN06295888_11072 [Desulfonatronum zhilinae]
MNFLGEDPDNSRQPERSLSLAFLPVRSGHVTNMSRHVQASPGRHECWQCQKSWRKQYGV